MWHLPLRMRRPQRVVECGASFIKFRLPLGMDDIYLGVVGNGFQHHMRHTFENKSLAYVGSEWTVRRWIASECGFLIGAFFAVKQQVRGMSRCGKTCTCKSECHPRRVDS